MGENAFELELPLAMGIHPVFNVSLLKLYQGDVPVPAPIEIDGELEYEIDAILEHRKMGRNLHFLVSWKGYDSSENMWIPERKMQHA